MAMSNKDLLPGDVLLKVSGNGTYGEVYLYLGYYDGLPYSMYAVPHSGHLYMYIEPVFMDEGQETDEDITRAAQPDNVYRHVFARARSGLDGNGSYVKGYKKFDRRIGHVDIEPIYPTIRHIWGLTRNMLRSSAHLD